MCKFSLANIQHRRKKNLNLKKKWKPEKKACSLFFTMQSFNILLFTDLVDVNVDTDSEVTVETIDDSDSLVFREPLFQEARRPTFGGYRF